MRQSNTLAKNHTTAKLRIFEEVTGLKGTKRVEKMRSCNSRTGEAVPNPVPIPISDSRLWHGPAVPLFQKTFPVSLLSPVKL